MTFPWRRHRSAQRGQALVEMAMMLPLLLLVVLLALDFGRVFFGWIGLQNAVRQGANYAALNPDAWGTPGDAAARADYLAQIAHDTATLNCAPESPAPAPTFPDGTALGGRVQVSMVCDFTPLTPLVGGLFQGGVVRIGASSTFPIRSGQIGGLNVGNTVPSSSPGAQTSGCDIPSFSGTRKNNAQTTWTIAGFSTTVTFLPGTGNYIIGYQSIGGGTLDQPCDSLITLGP